MNFLKDFLLFTVLFWFCVFWLLYSCWFKGCCILHNLLLESGVGEETHWQMSFLVKVTLKVSGLGLDGGCHRPVQGLNS